MYILVNGSFKQNIAGYIYNKDISKYYFLIFIFFLLIIFTGTEYLTPGDKYRWVAIKQFIKFGGYTDVSYDFRNMSPLSAETFLLFGMVIRGESLALMINILFPLFISISMLDFYLIEEKVQLKVAVLLTFIFIMNASFLIDATRGYISNTMSFFIWLVYFSLYKWNKTNNVKYFIISIFFAGFVAGTKLHGLLVILLFGLFVLFNPMGKKNIYFNIKKTLIFLIGSLFIASPWYIRNYYYTGDPIFPYLSQSFPIRRK